MATRLTVLAVLAALIVAAPLPAVAEGVSIAEGKALVDLYCADCHATGLTGESREPIAPRFRDLHDRYDVSLLAEALVEGLVTGHEMMPEFEFDPWQADSIIEYLETLAPNAGDAAAP